MQSAAGAVAKDATSLASLRVRGKVLSYRDWMVAHRARVDAQQQWRDLFRNFDVAIFPFIQSPHGRTTRRPIGRRDK